MLLLVEKKKKTQLWFPQVCGVFWCFSEDLFVLFCHVWLFYSLVYSHPQQLCFTVEHLTVKNTELVEVKTDVSHINLVSCYVNIVLAACAVASECSKINLYCSKANHLCIHRPDRMCNCLRKEREKRKRVNQTVAGLDRH